MFQPGTKDVKDLEYCVVSEVDLVVLNFEFWCGVEVDVDLNLICIACRCDCMWVRLSRTYSRAPASFSIFSSLPLLKWLACDDANMMPKIMSLMPKNYKIVMMMALKKTLMMMTLMVLLVSFNSVISSTEELSPDKDSRHR